VRRKALEVVVHGDADSSKVIAGGIEDITPAEGTTLSGGPGEDVIIAHHDTTCSRMII